MEIEKIKYPHESSPYPGPPHFCKICCHELSYEIYVSCLKCKNLDLCLSCFSKGPRIGKHLKEHRFAVIMPCIQEGFERGWTIQEELFFIQALGRDNSFNWARIASVIRTKTEDECRHHFYVCFIKARCAPDPRGGSIISYSDYKKDPVNFGNHFSERSIKTSACSLRPNSEANKMKAAKQEPSNVSSNYAPSIFKTNDFIKEYSEQYGIEDQPCSGKEGEKKGELSGFILKREEFEFHFDEVPESIPEMVTLDLEFNSDDNLDEFVAKLNILRGYDKHTIENSMRDSGLSKLESFREYAIQPTNIVDIKCHIPDKLLNPPISTYSTISEKNFSLVKYVRDPNEVEEASSIIRRTETMIKKNWLDIQKMPRVPLNVSDAFYLNYYLTLIGANNPKFQQQEKILEEKKKKKQEESKKKEEEKRKTEEEKKKKEEERRKNNPTLRMSLRKTSIIKRETSIIKKEAKPPKKEVIKLPVPLKVVNQWNRTAPLLQNTPLYDEPFLFFCSQKERDFLKEKKISASLYFNIKRTIAKYIIADIDNSIIDQNIVKSFPLYVVEAKLIKDFMIESKIFS